MSPRPGADVDLLVDRVAVALGDVLVDRLHSGEPVQREQLTIVGSTHPREQGPQVSDRPLGITMHPQAAHDLVDLGQHPVQLAEVQLQPGLPDVLHQRDRLGIHDQLTRHRHQAVTRRVGALGDLAGCSITDLENRVPQPQIFRRLLGRRGQGQEHVQAGSTQGHETCSTCARGRPPSQSAPARADRRGSVARYHSLRR